MIILKSLFNAQVVVYNEKTKEIAEASSSHILLSPVYVIYEDNKTKVFDTLTSMYDFGFVIIGEL